MSREATALRHDLRDLVKAHVPEDFLGAFTADPDDLEVAQAFCRLLAERGLLCMSWPEEFGGRGSSVWEQTVVREEMWAHHEPRGAQYMGVNWVGPDAHAPRHARAEAQAPAADRARRGDLVSGFQRTRGGLRSGVAAHGGDPRRRRLADQRPEDLDVVRHDGAVVLPAGADHRVARRSSGA